MKLLALLHVTECIKVNPGHKPIIYVFYELLVFKKLENHREIFAAMN